jgi:copper(I)-binding protein
MRKNFSAALFGAMIFSASAFAESGIEISDTWIRSAPPGASVMAGYMKLNNHSQHTVTLESASSPAFKRVEVHRTTMRNGMMHMESATLTLEPNQEIVFKPGGLHLMLIDPKKPLQRGDMATITFKFSNGEETGVMATVRDDEDGEDMMEMNMDHGDGHHHQ